MNLSGKASEIQKIQTAHRLKLIDFWEIPAGAKILEIGCGQGDTLAALAYVAGKAGFVHGVDIADETYGSPENLGQARERLLKSDLGETMKIDFGFNVLTETFSDLAFDYIVLSHCLWYFSSYSDLKDILVHVRPWGKYLCLAEWNPAAAAAGQLHHTTAVTIQAICACFNEQSQSNVRTMFYPFDIEKAVQDSGWVLDKAGDISSPDMQDGTWEMQTVLQFYPDEIKKLNGMPEKLKTLLLAQIHELSHFKTTEAMPAYCLRAKNL